jgi:sulfonate transport system substrate-binding protein
MQQCTITRRAFTLASFALVVLPARAQSAQPVKIGLSSLSLVTAALRIAKEQGIAERHGLDLSFVVMDSGNAILTALISRSLDFVVSGSAELIAARARAQKLVAIATTYRGFGPSMVLSKALAEKLKVSPDAPVAERLKALDGVVVGSPSATSVATVALQGSVQTVGASVRFAYIAQTALQAAFDSGAIQGFVASAPFWAPPVIKGSGLLWLSGPKGDFSPEHTPSFTGLLETRQDIVDANDGRIAMLRATLAEVVTAIRGNATQVRATLTKLYPNLDAQTLDLLFASESVGWMGAPPTAQDIAHDIAVMKANGQHIGGLDALNPSEIVLP